MPEGHHAYRCHNFMFRYNAFTATEHWAPLSSSVRLYFAAHFADNGHLADAAFRRVIKE